MVKTQAGDYRNEFSRFYFYIQLKEQGSEEFVRKQDNLGEHDYLFSKVSKLRLFEERYSFSELKEIISVTPKDNLKKANSLIEKINSELKNKSEDITKFKSLINDLCISLDGREL